MDPLDPLPQDPTHDERSLFHLTGSNTRGRTCQQQQLHLLEARWTDMSISPEQVYWMTMQSFSKA